MKFIYDGFNKFYGNLKNIIQKFSMNTGILLERFLKIHYNYSCITKLNIDNLS